MTDMVVAAALEACLIGKPSCLGGLESWQQQSWQPLQRLVIEVLRRNL